jgi:hypothetical protein
LEVIGLSFAESTDLKCEPLLRLRVDQTLEVQLNLVSTVLAAVKKCETVLAFPDFQLFHYPSIVAMRQNCRPF